MQIRVLISATRWSRLEKLVELILTMQKHYSRNEVLGAVDYLANRRLLELRRPQNKANGSLYTKVTEHVPTTRPEMVRLLLQIHGLLKPN